MECSFKSERAPNSTVMDGQKYNAVKVTADGMTRSHQKLVYLSYIGFYGNQMLGVAEPDLIVHVRYEKGKFKKQHLVSSIEVLQK